MSRGKVIALVVALGLLLLLLAMAESCRSDQPPHRADDVGGKVIHTVPRKWNV